MRTHGGRGRRVECVQDADRVRLDGELAYLLAGGSGRNRDAQVTDEAWEIVTQTWLYLLRAPAYEYWPDAVACQPGMQVRIVVVPRRVV